MKKTKLISILTALTMITSYSAITTAYSLGDANNDGFVNVRDCAHIARSLANGTASSLSSEADYNSDGTINVRDAANLASALAKGPVAENPEYEYKGTLATGGDVMTVMCWTGDDLDLMLETWMENEGYTDEQVHFINLGVGGGEAEKLYQEYFLGGEQIDMFLVEPDWALKYLDDDNFTAPISELGFTESDFKNQYSYTLELGRDSDGVLKGVSYDAAPGGWCYRTDLAEKYLGVKSPSDMQNLVSDWYKFETTAQKLYTASNGQTTITSTFSGMNQAYMESRTEPMVKNGKFTAEQFVRDFMSLSKRMSNAGYVNPDIYAWTDDWYELGISDSNMGYFVPTWGFGSAILETAAGGEEGATYGKWAVCEGPSPYYWGGNSICVTPYTDNADMVASFINYYTVNSDTMKAYNIEANQYDHEKMVNNTVAIEELISDGSNKNPLLGGQAEYEVLHEVGKNLDLDGCITPYDSDISLALGIATGKYTRGEVATLDECYDVFKGYLLEYAPELIIE